MASLGLTLFLPFLINKIKGMQNKNKTPKYRKTSIYDSTVLCLVTPNSMTL